MTGNNAQDISCNAVRLQGTNLHESSVSSICTDQTVKTVTIYFSTREVSPYLAVKSLRVHFKDIWKPACYTFDSVTFVVQDKVA